MTIMQMWETTALDLIEVGVYLLAQRFVQIETLHTSRLCTYPEQLLFHDRRFCFTVGPYLHFKRI